MFSPKFDQLPAWVCWVAQDADGAWWAFEHEPNLSHRSWYENEVGRVLGLGKGQIMGDWRDSLMIV